jgi:hypothetical protein
LGCPYEFVKCYLEKKCNTNEDDSIEDSDVADSERGHVPKQGGENKDDEEHLGCGKITICIILIIVGVFLQPIYLMFYILYGMMECYRRYGCWVFFVYY